MRITSKRTVSAVQVLKGAQVLLESANIEMFTGEEPQALGQQRRGELELQMPPFALGDKEEDAAEYSSSLSTTCTFN
jgi:hypothetical protein